MTLGSRLALLFGMVALAVSAVVGAASYRVTSSQVSSATDGFLQTRAGDVADGNRESPRDRRSGGTTLAFDPDAIVQVTNDEGQVIATSGADLPITDPVLKLIDAQSGKDRREPRGAFENITIEGEPYRMYSVALASGGVIQVARSTAEDNSLLSNLLARFGLIVLLATVGASLLGWWIARRTTRPLRDLADVASMVASTGDFSVDVPVERSDEIGTLAASMRTMLATLETSRRQQHSLVQDASHELRTPLTSLRANVALLERIEQSPSALSPQDRADVLSAISSEASELGSLFDELVDLATSSEDRDAPQVELRLDALVERAVGRWGQRTERAIEVRTTAVTVNGNEAMLERAVTNLIGNAHKFSPLDEPIEVVVEALDGQAVVSVSDGGPGIAIEDRERVFDRFHRAEATRTMPGSGLGLAIVAQIIEHHHGEVWATASTRGGAMVGFRIPAVSNP